MSPSLDSVGLFGLKSQTYFWTSAATLQAYEYAITLNSEMTLIWAAPWSLVKVLFILARYIGFVETSIILYNVFGVDVSSEACRINVVVSGWLYVTGIAVSEIILLLRTWALWNCRKLIGAILLVVFLGACACAVAIETRLGSSLNVHYSDVLHFPGSRCTKHAYPPIVIADFAIVIFIETVVLILTIAKIVHQHRSRVFSGFMKVVYRDGIVFFVYMLGISVANLSLVPLSSDAAKNVLIGIQRIFHSILSVRVILHLREARRRDEQRSCERSLPLDASTVVLVTASSSSSEVL